MSQVQGKNDGDTSGGGNSCPGRQYVSRTQYLEAGINLNEKIQ